LAIGEELRARLLGYQRNELTEYRIYRRLAEAVSGGPTELDRNRGAVSEALLGSCYAALSWGWTPK